MLEMGKHFKNISGFVCGRLGCTSYALLKCFWGLLLFSVVAITVSYLSPSNRKLFVDNWRNWKTAVISQHTYKRISSYNPKNKVVWKKHEFISSGLANGHRNGSLKQQNNSSTVTKQNHKTPTPPRTTPKLNKEDRSNISAVIYKRDCKLWQNGPNKVKKKFKPQIELDPTKFLYPGLVWGPNNQIVGFWQSIYLAIRLNRTLVIPRFHAHRTTGGGTILANHRIDVDRLRRFVSSISIEQFREICNYSFDVVLQAQKSNPATIKDFESETGMSILHIEKHRIDFQNGATQLRFKDGHHGNNYSNIPAFPPESYQLTYDPWITGDTEALRKAYNTSARCALYSAPFQTIRLEGPNNSIAKPLTTKLLHQTDIKDKELFSAVLYSVRRPVGIENAVKQFKTEVFNNEPYVAVHWRYDLTDWEHHHCRPNHPERYTKFCRDLPKITPQDVAAGIFASLKEANLSQSAWKHVYIASPPTLRIFSNQVLKALQNLNSFVDISKTQLDVFMTARYQVCWKQGKWSNEKEIFSLAEMEVLAQSEWFFFSSGSTFSSNVRPMRWKKTQSGKVIKKFETSVYDIARNAMMKRLVWK